MFRPASGWFTAIAAGALACSSGERAAAQQRMAADLHYAPLPDTLVGMVRARLGAS